MKWQIFSLNKTLKNFPKIYLVKVYSFSMNLIVIINVIIIVIVNHIRIIESNLHCYLIITLHLVEIFFFVGGKNLYNEI